MGNLLNTLTIYDCRQAIYSLQISQGEGEGEGYKVKFIEALWWAAIVPAGRANAPDWRSDRNFISVTEAIQNATGNWEYSEKILYNS